MAWIMLIIAGLFEVAFTTCLKMSANFSKFWWSAGFFVSITLSFVFLNKSIQQIPLGTAYAVWTGIGAVGTVVIGVLVFEEPSHFLRLFFLSTLISSLIGLKLVS